MTTYYGQIDYASLYLPFGQQHFLPATRHVSRESSQICENTGVSPLGIPPSPSSGAKRMPITSLLLTLKISEKRVSSTPVIWRNELMLNSDYLHAIVRAPFELALRIQGKTSGTQELVNSPVVLALVI